MNARISAAINLVGAPLLADERIEGLPPDLVADLLAIRQNKDARKLARRAQAMAAEFVETVFYDAALDASVLAAREGLQSATSHLLETVEALRLDLRQALIARGKLLRRLAPTHPAYAWELERRASGQDLRG